MAAREKMKATGSEQDGGRWGKYYQGYGEGIFR